MPLLPWYSQWFFSLYFFFWWYFCKSLDFSATKVYGSISTVLWFFLILVSILNFFISVGFAYASWALSLCVCDLCWRRFVRFVSTPEILERFTSIEREISHIESSIHLNGLSTSTVSWLSFVTPAYGGIEFWNVKLLVSHFYFLLLGGDTQAPNLNVGGQTEEGMNQLFHKHTVLLNLS